MSLIFPTNIDCRCLSELPYEGDSNKHLQSMLGPKIRKMLQFFCLKNTFHRAMKDSIELHGCVILMLLV